MSTHPVKSKLVWEVSPAWKDSCVERLLDDGQRHVVKQGAHRTVYRIDAGGQSLFVKHYRCRPWVGLWRHLFRASNSRREWRKALEVARRKIPTARPIAVAEQKPGWLVRDNYYVCEGVPESQSLDDYVRDVLPRLAPRERSRQWRQILDALARLTAAAHDAGIDHNDFHTGNILIRMGPAQSEPELYLIDLPGVRLSGPLDWPRSRDSLAMLGGGWLQKLSRADRCRFWRTYQQQRISKGGTFQPTASEDIFRGMHAHARRVARQRDKRCLRSNRDFQRIAVPAATVHGMRDLSGEQLAALARDPEHLLRTHRHEPVKIGHASLLVQARLEIGGQTTNIAYKRSRARSFWKRMVAGLRRSRALGAWRIGHALLARGIATAQPLAVVQPKPFHGESFLATAWIEGALNLHLYGWALAGRDANERHRRACQAAESLGRLLARMHAWHVSHGDLKGCNLVVVEQSESVASYLIDLDSVRFLRRMSDNQRAVDLSRLAASMEAHPWLSRTVRLRFLRAYLQGAGSDWKPLWRRIARHTAPILARFRQQGRPVA